MLIYLNNWSKIMQKCIKNNPMIYYLIMKLINNKNLNKMYRRTLKILNKNYPKVS